MAGSEFTLQQSDSEHKSNNLALPGLSGELDEVSSGMTGQPAHPVSAESSAGFLRSLGNSTSRQSNFQTLQRLYGNSYATKVAANFQKLKPPVAAPVIARELAEDEEVQDAAEQNLEFQEATQELQPVQEAQPLSNRPVQRVVQFGTRPGTEIARARRNRKSRRRRNQGGGGGSDPLGKAVTAVKERTDYEGVELESEGDSVWGTDEYTTGHGDEVEEDEEANLLDLASYFDLNKIVIDLGQIEKTKNVGGAEVTGSAKGKANKEGVEGEGELQVVFGKSKATDEKKMGWDIKGSRLDASGKVEGFIGAKAKAKAKANANWTKKEFAMKGKTSAFIGGSVEVEVKTGLEAVASVEGTLGLTLGVGGEYEGQVTWSGGVFKFGGKAKMAAGVGFGFSYKVEIETASIMKRVYSALGWMASWLGY